MSELRTIYVTKWLFTQGIVEFEGKIGNGGATIKIDGYFNTKISDKDFFLSRDEALAHAEEMRIKKLEELDKEMKKISAMKFD